VLNDSSYLQLIPKYTYTAVLPINSLVTTYTPTDTLSTFRQALN